MNRRDFVTKLLGVSAVAVCAKSGALNTDSVNSAPEVTIKRIPVEPGPFYHDAVSELRMAYQEQASREMALRLDNIIMRNLSNG